MNTPAASYADAKGRGDPVANAPSKNQADPLTEDEEIRAQENWSAIIRCAPWVAEFVVEFAKQNDPIEAKRMLANASIRRVDSDDQISTRALP